jgi:type II secretory pathway pseudopilin PulG
MNNGKGVTAACPAGMTRVYNRARSPISGTAGMTLVELLISVGIMTIIMGISIGIFVGQFKSYRSSRSAKSSQGDAQKALSIIKEEIALAGWGVKPQMAFYFLDGGASQPDQIYVNDTTIIGVFPDNATKTTRHLLKMVDSNCAACRGYKGTSWTGNLEIDDGKSDFDGVPALMLTGDNATPGNDLSSILASAADNGTLVTPAFHYCVDDGNATHSCYSPTPTAVHRALRREGRDTGGALQPMAENVVDLQVVYQGDDNVTYGTTAAPQMNPFNPSKIKKVDLTIVTRSSDRVRSPSDPNSCRPRAGNHSGSTAATDCGYEYRAYTTRITPFNSFK